MFWGEDILFSKAKKYAALAENNSDLKKLFSAITVEFLGRACLSKVNPTLLADPRDGKNLLYAAGVANTEPPFKSIVAKTVFDRCHTIIRAFDKEYFNASMLLIEARNSELHSGEEALDELPVEWEVHYYVICKIFLEHLNRNLKDLFPSSSVAHVTKVIDGYKRGIDGEVKKRIAACKAVYDQLDGSEKKQRQKKSVELLKDLRKSVENSSTHQCPSCANFGLLSGEITEYSDSKIIDNEIVYDKRIFPTNFKCLVCNLNLSSYSELVSAGISSSFTVQEIQDPIEYFNINPRDYLSSDEIEEIVREYQYDDYGND